jgi:diaminohydroxyphosphoribosylaminopyrimidine deaminase/5-amino-6-(5-phosphoribosylamino)uracil reductase
MTGPPSVVLDELGAKGVLQLLVEGGAQVAHEFHHAGVVDRYVLYVTPAMFGGDDGVPMFAGPGAPTVASLWRGRVVSLARLGDDLRIELEARDPASPTPPGPGVEEVA